MLKQTTDKVEFISEVAFSIQVKASALATDSLKIGEQAMDLANIYELQPAFQVAMGPYN